MLSWPSNIQVFLCAQPVDCRKSFDGLCAIVENVFQKNIFDGHLFLFLNKRRDRLKALWWDRDGVAIFYKRLEQGVFEMPIIADGQSHMTLDATAFSMLLAGVPLATQRRKRYSRSAA